MLKLKKLLKEAAEYKDVFGVKIARVVQNEEDVAYRVFYSHGRRTTSVLFNAMQRKEHSIELLGDDKAFENAKKEALKIVKGWK
jgi:aspartate carbamoyltransferase catalytic subunit